MLSIVVLGEEQFNNETYEFTTLGDVVLEFEHSLVSLSKWEEKHEKAFLGKGDKTTEEIFDYLKCMVLTPNVPEEVFHNLSDENIESINQYIEAKHSATTFGALPKERGTGETITAELIYYWMIGLNIPFECQYWHLNRLFSLIRVCGIKNSPPKKMSKAQMVAERNRINQQRREQYGTRG